MMARCSLNPVHRIAIMIAVGLMAWQPTSVASGQEPDKSLATGTTSKAQRAAAANRIPFDQLEEAVADKVANVVRDASIYRQLPVTSIKTDPDFYLTLLRYPEIIVSTWQLMGVTKMNSRRVAPFVLDCSDGAGTKTRTQLVYGDPHVNVYYSEGEYDGPMLFRKVTGKCVILVETRYEADEAGNPRTTTRMNLFLHIDNMAANLIARSIHPLVGTTADHNFVETLKFVESLSHSASINGPGVQRLADKLTGLDPDVRDRFRDVAGLAWQRSMKRQLVSESSQRTPQTMQAGFTVPSVSIGDK
jgi:hypothetical protein